MRSKLAVILILSMILTSLVASAASDNGVDKYLKVKSDYEFVPGGVFVYLRIEEKNANEFGANPQNFKLELDGAAWFDDGEAIDTGTMETHTLSNLSDNVTIDRISSSRIEVELDRKNTSTNEKAYWRIPIYCEATGEEELSINVIGGNSAISSSNNAFAIIYSSDSFPVGYKFDQSNKYWLAIKEPALNAFGTEDQRFRLELVNSEWFSDTNTRLSPQEMLKDSILSGVDQAEIKSIERISDKIIEVTLNRGAGSSVKGQAVWSIPLYHIVTELGKVTYRINSLDSMVDEGTFTKEPVKEMVVIDPSVVRVQIGNSILKFIENNIETEVILDAAPFNPRGTTLVPLRGILESLGADVVWHSETRQVEIIRNDLTVVLTIDSNIAIVDFKEVLMIEPAQIVNDRTMIPLRFVSENLGYKVDWYSETQTIDIYEE